MEELKLISLDLSVLSEDVIEVLLLDINVEPSLFDEIAHKNTHRSTVLHHLLNHPKTPETTRQFIAQALQLPVHVPPRVEVEKEEIREETRTQTLLQKIQGMRVNEKIQLALRGSREIRSILIRDSHKEVMLSVLENPRITESEIEIIAKQKTSPEEILRTVAKKREWMRNYFIVHALVTNPKTPTGTALSHINTLRLNDLILLEKNKFVSEAIRAAAKKLVTARKPS